MIANKALFTKGAVLLGAFFAVLFTMFMPLTEHGNFLNYMDNLYNMISKGSAYYIPKMRDESAAFKGTQISVEITMATDKQAAGTAPLFLKGGATVNQNGTQLNISGDLATIMENCLADADAMFANNGKIVKDKYGYNEKEVLFNWWTAINKMDYALKKQEKFPEAKLLGNVNQRAVECAFNYYTIKPEKIADKFGIVIFSLVFYVIYTLWFGFAIMFMFEGWGMKLSH